MKNRDGSLSARLNGFFFAKEVPYGLALMRMFLPAVLLGLCLKNWIHVRSIYSTDGVIVQLSQSYGWGRWLPEFGPTMAVALHSLLIVALVFSIIGFYTRISLVTAFVLYTYFPMIDMLSTATKYTVIATHLLLLLAVSNCGAIWSIDAKRKRLSRPGRSPGEPRIVHPKFDAWPRRLVQLLIGIIYFGAAMTKLKTAGFFSGDQLKYWMVTNYNNVKPLGELMTLWPSLLAVFSYIAIVWEFTFLFVAWNGIGRLAAIFMGMCFHTMTALTLGLFVFPLVSFACYLAFINEKDVQAIGKWMRKRALKKARKKKLPLARKPWPEAKPAWNWKPLPLATACGVLLFLAGSVVVERAMDYYGENNPTGRYQLTAIPADKAEELFATEAPLREKDKFFSFDIGTLFIANNLVNRREEFTHGETAWVQAGLQAPHEDLVVDCSLQDANGRILTRLPAIAIREQLRCLWRFKMTEDLPPGDYSFILRSSGKQVFRRDFTLHGGAGTALAN